MAKWWLLNVQFPEKSDRDVLQIYAADVKQAREVADTWLRQAGVVGPQERLVIEVRGAGRGDQFPNAPVISSAGIKNAPGGGGALGEPAGDGAPPPGGGSPPPSGESPTGLEEKEPQAAFLRALAQRGVDPSTIMWRAQTNEQSFSDYLNTFNFGSLLQGFNPLGSNAEGQNTRYGDLGRPGTSAGLDAFQNFTRGKDIGGVRQSAANALTDLLNARPVGSLQSTLPYLREQFGQPDETQAALLAQLAKTALANGVSPLALRYLRLPSGEDLRNRFLAQGGGGSFLEYFKSQYPMLAGL